MPTPRWPSDTVLDLVSRLIGFDTVSRKSNLGLIEWVRDDLARHGVPARLTYDATGGKANLFATLGEDRDGGLILSGHTDVVPVDGQDWSTDPFAATVRNGRVYGRGAADMKSFIAVALAAVPRILAQRREAPIHLALSYDEEVGCIGVRGLLRDLADRGLKPAGCIVGEPTGMAIAIGHKGGRTWRCDVRGRAAHAALAPRAVNAIEYAARLIVRMRALADDFAAREPHDPAYDVPHSTLMTGLIQGGLATNIVPQACEFRFAMRHLPASDPEHLLAAVRAHAASELVPEMRRLAPDADIVFEQTGEVPAFAIEPDAPLVRLVAGKLGLVGAPRHVVFGSEAGLFQQAGIPAVLCGPGAIEQAHRPDEFIALDQIARCEAFIATL